MREPKLSSLSILTTDARTRRRQENQRKNDSYMDAARHAPELRDPAKEQLMLQNCIDQQGAQKQLCGVRTACMLLYGFATAGRGEQARNLRVCQRLNLDATPLDDSDCSMQTVEIMAFTKDIGKTSSGDTRDLAAIAPHKNVSLQYRCKSCYVSFSDYFCAAEAQAIIAVPIPAPMCSLCARSRVFVACSHGLSLSMFSSLLSLCRCCSASKWRMPCTGAYRSYSWDGLCQTPPARKPTTGTISLPRPQSPLP